MKVIHVSAECYPMAKVGGLADVVGSLPKYQEKLNTSSNVIMPFYDNKFTKEHEFKVVFKSSIILGEKKYSYRILTLKKSTLGFDLFMVDIPTLLFKEYVYSEDDTLRFLAFSIAVLDWFSQRNVTFDLVHCHDHQTGLIPFMMSYCPQFASLSKIPTVITIHNAQYQGWFSHDLTNLIPSFDKKHRGLLDWDGVVNPLATAIKCAWRVTTVSSSYMKELMLRANGLEALLTHEHAKCQGILNGIDFDVWSPETDDFLKKTYKNTDVQSGRKSNKKWLCEKFNLDPQQPLFAFIGRLVGEKGADLLPLVFEKILKEEDCSVLVLGSGNKNIEGQLQELKERFKGAYNAFIGYDESLSHMIYGGADFLLMPSRVEPCGLNQLYALRYGCIPIVRSIGGLKDTVVDIATKNGVGICHENVSTNEICNAIKRGKHLYKDQETFRKIRKQGMNLNHSWEASANSYIQLYKSLT